MPTQDMLENKKNYANHKKEIKHFSNDLNKHHNKEKFDKEIVRANDKAKGINYYNSLSESEKLVFQRELQKKEIREDYAKYLKYVYKDNYTITKYHMLLIKICEKAVDLVEHNKSKIICLSVPPQTGKGYPVDFPILTTKGWKKHGELQVGDYVYNDKGEQVMVLGNQKPYMHPCLKVNFANGESHIVTKEHLWKVYLEKELRINKTHKNIRYEKIIETQELMKILPKCRRSPYVLINEALKNEEKDFAISPYVLGLWLGDGCSATNEIVVSDSDLSNELVAIGDKEIYSVIKRKGNPSVSYIKLGKEKRKIVKNGFTNDFRERLNNLGLLHNKHIPIDYLLASEEQRWELLRGLMDTDGSCDKKGGCEFCNTNKELAYNVYTLLHSLGIKARIGEYDAKLYGRFISKKYRVMFNPNKTDHIFNLERKQNIIVNKTKKDREDKFKYFIKSIEEVGDKLVSCISVEGGVYLAGKELIPTHNSMTVTESLPSWFLGRNPDLRCILTAYNGDIAEKFGDKNRQKVKDFGKDIFGIEISDSQDNKTLWDIKGHQGGLYSAGILGGLTSNGGALIIVDDPFKNGEEANNKTIRDRVWEIFGDTVSTRVRIEGAVTIVIHTRWHEDDLIGRIMKAELGNEVICVNLPAIWEKGEDKLMHRRIGETLVPERGMTTDFLEKQKKLLGIRKFYALYQGMPFVEGGEIVKRDYFKFYTKASLPSVFEEITMSCDLSFGSTKNSFDDPCGIGIFGRVGGNHYLLEYIIKKLSFTDTLERIRYFCGKYPMMKKKLIEAKANGNATIEILNREIGGFVAYNPKESKEERLNLCLPFFEAGNVFFPSEEIDKNIEEQIQVFLRFPKVTHEEIVDITTQYLLNYQYKYSGKLNTDKRYSQLAKAIRGFRV